MVTLYLMKITSHLQFADSEALKGRTGPFIFKVTAMQQRFDGIITGCKKPRERMQEGRNHEFNMN